MRLSFTDAAGGPADAGIAELGVSKPSSDAGVERTWRRELTAGDDARIVLSWLRNNQLADRVGVDTDLLVHLFIEAAINGSAGMATCDGDFLATLAGTGQWAGTAATARWSLAISLPPAGVAAVLDAIADSGPRWGYAITAARDPDAPAGQVRRRLLEDLRGQ